MRRTCPVRLSVGAFARRLEGGPRSFSRWMRQRGAPLDSANHARRTARRNPRSSSPGLHCSTVSRTSPGFLSTPPPRRSHPRSHSRRKNTSHGSAETHRNRASRPSETPFPTNLQPLLKLGLFRRGSLCTSLLLSNAGTGGGTRTRTGIAPQRILSPLRLPFRHTGIQRECSLEPPPPPLCKTSSHRKPRASCPSTALPPLQSTPNSPTPLGAFQALRISDTLRARSSSILASPAPSCPLSTHTAFLGSNALPQPAQRIGLKHSLTSVLNAS